MKNQPGGAHESRTGLYSGRPWTAKREGTAGVALCLGASSPAPTEGGVGLGADWRGDGAVLAGGRQKRRWGTEGSVADRVVRPVISTNGSQGAQQSADGRILCRECGGASLFRPDGAGEARGARSLQHRAGAGGPRSPRVARSQPVVRGRGRQVGLWAAGGGVRGHHGAGAPDRLSARGGDLAGDRATGAAQLTAICEWMRPDSHNAETSAGCRAG